ncbi:pilus assembly protein TadG-related protein [Cryptosporangium japonicum]|uniref:Putative Flp pilus-assembly TadG-like N-terminal domain-containing protein n=1 Tax=Cryptosporangium japonicum TaxID=80872 RepID=A0ABN0TVL8_9ACTN
MRRLTRRHWWDRILARRPSGERGAVAVIAAAVMGGGLLFGMGALVIDVGKLYDEREQLQSGADLASWALAKRCITAATRAQCGAQAALAATLAGSNAKDSATNVSAICGRFAGLSTCAAQTAKLSDCVGTPPATANYLQVQTSTKEADGTTKVPPVFANLLDSSNTGSSVGACSRVAWGIPSTATVLAIGIGRCEFLNMTNSGLVYNLVSGVGGLLTGVLGDTGTAVAGLLGVAPPATGGQLVFIHDTIGKVNTSPACSVGAPASPPPWTGGNGFGFLDGAYSDANCVQTVTVGDVLPASDLGVLAPVNCLAPLQNAVTTGSPVLVPIYDYQWNPLINLSAYTVRIAGFAAFVVRGYQLGLLNGVLKTVGSLLNVSGNPTCTVVVDYCINGYFTQAIIPAPSVSIGSLGTTDYGVSLITRVG